MTTTASAPPISRYPTPTLGDLPDDIREQASWGRLLSDPEWASPLPPRGTPRKIPFIDITDSYERSAA